MTEYTTNYNLEKQQGTDYINIAGLNNNFDIIDTIIKALDSNKANKSKVISATLINSAWTGTAAPYTQTVSVTGVTSSNNCTVAIAPGATSAQYAAGVDAQLHPSAQATDSITIAAFDTKPTVDIPIVVMILG